MQITSSLLVRLVDGVSAPAGNAMRAINGIGHAIDTLDGKHSAVVAAGNGVVQPPNAPRRAPLRGNRASVGVIPPMPLGALAGTASVYTAGRVATDAYKEFASFDRRMTYIGITADAAMDQVDAAKAKLKELATENSLTNEQIVSGVEALVAQGRSLPEAMDFMSPISKTALAAGAQVEDIAVMSDSLARSLGITSEQMQAAFDVAVYGGKSGKFELKDMAAEFPAVAAAAAAAGLKGKDGLMFIVSALQMIRNQTGSGAEAATNLKNFFQKIETKEKSNNFADFGVNIREELAKARAQGKPILDVYLDLIEKAIGGDLTKLPQLFTDFQDAGAARALLMQRQELAKLRAELGSVDGTVMKDFAKVTGDAQAAVDRLGNSWQNMLQAFGNTFDALGVSSFFNKIARGADQLANETNMISDMGYSAAQNKLEKTPGTPQFESAQRRMALRKAELEDFVKNHPTQIGPRPATPGSAGATWEKMQRDKVAQAQAELDALKAGKELPKPKNELRVNRDPNDLENRFTKWLFGRSAPSVSVPSSPPAARPDDFRAPPAPVTKNQRVDVNVGGITINVAQGDPDVIADLVAGRLDERLRNVSSGLMADMDYTN
jgi:TP901 family phage tail tape measure protein